MQRWNEERALMQRRWDRETAHHTEQQWYYDLYCIDRRVCGCERGIGIFRKIRRDGRERGSRRVWYIKRSERRAERQEARGAIIEQMHDDPITSYTVGRRRVAFRFDWLD